MKLFHLFSWLLLSNSHLVKSTCYFILKRFCSLKNERDADQLLMTSRVIFFLKCRLRFSVGIFNNISEKHSRYSRFVKTTIAIEAQLYL